MCLSAFTAGCNEADDASGREPLSRHEYRQAMLDIQRDAATATRLYDEMVVQRLPQRQCASRMERFHSEVSRIVARAAALRPPMTVARTHEEMVTAALESVQRVGAIEAQVARREITCGRELNEVLYGMPSTERAEQKLAELADRGYILGFH